MYRDSTYKLSGRGKPPEKEAEWWLPRAAGSGREQGP